VPAFILALLLSFAAAVTTAESVVVAQSQPGRQEVLRLLEGYEWRLNSAHFEHLGPLTYRTLIEIIGDEASLSYVQGRAFAGLTLFNNDEVWQFLLTRLATSTGDSVRRRALETICELFSETKSEQLASLLPPYLQSDDVHLRTKVARCLTRVDQLNPKIETSLELRAYRDSIQERWEVRAAGFEQ